MLEVKAATGGNYGGVDGEDDGNVGDADDESNDRPYMMMLLTKVKVDEDILWK